MEKLFIIYVNVSLNATKRASLVWNDNQTHIRVSGLTDRGEKGDLTPGKQNVKTGPPPVDILIFSIL